MSTLAPIALFVYRRLGHARQTLEALQADPLARDSDVIVFSDGARQPQHEADVRAVRTLLKEKWAFRSVTLVERETNLGLAKSITDGIGRLCAEYGRVIAIEDDVVIAPGCLGFLNRALDRYVDEEQVYQVSAYSYPADFSASGDAFFLPMISCWAWATWARAWRHFDSSLPGLDRLRADATLRRRFNIDGAYDYYAMACQQADGKIDSWGVCWQLNTFMGGGLVLYPRRSLAQNRGVDSSGTHGSGEARLQGVADGRWLETGSIRFPDSVALDQQAFSQVSNLLSSIRPGITRRLIDWIRA